jgi:hypothetical protein
MFRIIVLLAIVNDALVRQENDVRLTVIENLLTIAGVPAMMGSDENGCLSQTLTESLPL